MQQAASWKRRAEDIAMTSLSEANAKFAIDFFHLLRKEHSCGNILFSPANLSTALHLLLYGSRHGTKAEIEKVLHHLKKAEEHASSGTRSDSATKIECLESKLRLDLSNLPNAQTTARIAGCEAEEVASSPVTSGEDESNLELSVEETSCELGAEEGSPAYFIPWRKHLQGLEEAENLIQEWSSPKGKVSWNPSTSHENQEEQSVSDSMVAAEADLHTSSHEGSDNISALLSEFRHIVKHADNNVQAFKETFGIFTECCDKVCASMSNLQAVLEALVTILRE